MADVSCINQYLNFVGLSGNVCTFQTFIQKHGCIMLSYKCCKEVGDDKALCQLLPLNCCWSIPAPCFYYPASLTCLTSDRGVKRAKKMEE